MYDFTIPAQDSSRMSIHAAEESRAVLDCGDVIYTVGFGADHKNQSSGYCILVQDKSRNLLRSQITGTIAGYNYFSDWSAYK